jgi:hypothetical protein
MNRNWYVIRIEGCAHPCVRCPYGQYLVAYDPDGMGGFGLIRTTRDLREAKQFAHFADASALWRSQSTVRPLRVDGLPNRPLTAFTVSIITVEVAMAKENRRWWRETG